MSQLFVGSGAAISRLLALAERDGDREREVRGNGQIDKYPFGSFSSDPGKWRWLFLEVEKAKEAEPLLARSGYGK